MEDADTEAFRGISEFPIDHFPVISNGKIDFYVSIWWQKGEKKRLSSGISFAYLNTWIVGWRSLREKISTENHPYQRL
jgi:hypothetical protein